MNASSYIPCPGESGRKFGRHSNAGEAKPYSMSPSGMDLFFIKGGKIMFTQERYEAMKPVLGLTKTQTGDLAAIACAQEETGKRAICLDEVRFLQEGKGNERGESSKPRLTGTTL